jgi:hypothetical protein
VVTPFSEKNLGKFWECFYWKKKGISDRLFFLKIPFGDFQPENYWVPKP